ncbi:MAG: N-acetyl-gamma-glutamyl-phosphate reductase, partial [Pseudomonadota bacterium]|nr:N-acetyl-gamma-glutamyl-phosphate reductase [Pseudomonadota bacterium]
RLVLTARLDNLGKGASGAAVQNLNLMLGRDMLAGLSV